MALLALGALSCDPKPTTAVVPAPLPTPASPQAPAVAAVDDARGGQLFDCWWALEPYRSAFVPDDPTTPEAADGSGGPNGDGTLNDERGQRIVNDGHAYRLKSFFGWDLRGARGLYGPKHQNKAYVLGQDLLAFPGDAPALAERLARGGEGLPAFGEVLAPADIENLAHFIIRVRDGALAHPDRIFVLDEASPKSYRLRDGGDPARGKELYAETCAPCHGGDGKRKILEEAYSLGSHARTAAFEDWFKILNGQPATAMGRQLPKELDGAAQAHFILDLLAALCDRTAFPAHLAEHDAPDGDPRCGAYLE